MVEGIPLDQVGPSRMVSVLGLKLDHDKNEFLFNLDEKSQNYDVNVVVSVQVQSDFISRRNRTYIPSGGFLPTFKIIVACMSSKLENSERRKGERNSF